MISFKLFLLQEEERTDFAAGVNWEDPGLDPFEAAKVLINNAKSFVSGKEDNSYGGKVLTPQSVSGGMADVELAAVLAGTKKATWLDGGAFNIRKVLSFTPKKATKTYEIRQNNEEMVNRALVLMAQKQGFTILTTPKHGTFIGKDERDVRELARLGGRQKELAKIKDDQQMPYKDVDVEKGIGYGLGYEKGEVDKYATQDTMFPWFQRPRQEDPPFIPSTPYDKVTLAATKDKKVT